ncbi:MAG: DUF4339 domain-containing protein [Verrucomicrobia bacterium]|nr:DUF4339 domain-containing protein [Verrucomicrobiota bacterium]
MSDPYNAIEVSEAAIQFSVIKLGQQTPVGPYTQDDILSLLQNGALERQDLVYYDGMADWAAIEDVFDIQEEITHFIDDNQDQSAVAQAFREITPILASEENIYYVAVQKHSGLLSRSKSCVILTNLRIVILKIKKSGSEMEIHKWSSVGDFSMKDEGNNLGTFSATMQQGKGFDITHIPLAQVQRLIQLSQEMGGV